MKIKIVEQAGRNTLVQLSTEWCSACKVTQKMLYDRGIRHIYINPEDKFVVNYFSAEPGDIQLAIEIIKKVGKIKGWPTFAVYKADGTLELANPTYDPRNLIKKYNIIGGWR